MSQIGYLNYYIDPCLVTGECSDCIVPNCGCASMATTRMSKPSKRIRVVLIDEDLGI